MRKLLTIFVIISSFSLSAQETPQWEFWLAFEDATGAKDTLWVGLDTDATLQLDAEFGEVPVNIDNGQFNTYIMAPTGEYVKSLVIQLFIPPTFEVLANNYTYPIELSWDTTLFNAPILANSEEGPINNPLMDNEYFFNYHEGFPSYHMLFEESVEMPQFFFGSMDHFPVFFSFNRGFGEPINTSDEMREKLSIYPNPTTDQIQVSGREGIRRVSIFSLSGKLMMQEVITEDRPINVSHLNEGAYIVQVETEKGVAISKFVKARP